MKFYKSHINFRILGLFLLSINFLPLEAIFGDIKGFKWSISPYMWTLSILICLAISWLLNAIFPNLVEKTTTLSKQIHNLFCFISKYQLIIFSSLLLVISKYAFSGRPLLIDSIVQLFQAEIFASGTLKASYPRYPEFFVTQHMIIDQDGWYGQYPPGHSILLLLGVLIKAPWIISIILTSITSLIIYKFSRNIFGEEVAKFTLFLLMLSPFFMFMGASFMNHVSILFWISLWLYTFERYEKTISQKYLLISSFAVGMGMLVRPLDTVATGLTLIPVYLVLIRKNLSNIIYIALGILPPLISGLWYNLRTTGDALIPGYIKLWGKAHGLGFHQSPWGKEHTPITGLRNELVDLQLLNEMLFEWPIPSLTFVSLLLIFSNFSNTWARRLLGIGLSYPFLYFFYWHRDAFMGPRFMYSSIIAWIPLTGFAIYELLKISNNKSFHPFGLFHKFKISNFIYTILTFSIFFAVIINIPQRFRSYQTSLISMKQDILDSAKNFGINSGIIFVKSSWGVRIMSQLRGLGLSASLTQIAYSNLDHCLLDEIITKAQIESWDQNTISNEITQNLNHGKKAYTTKINFDHSLKLDPKRPLTYKCKEELKYDLNNGEQNYTNYEPHIRSNHPHFLGNFIVAKDLRERNSILIREYPKFKAYLFDGVQFSEINKN